MIKHNFSAGPSILPKEVIKTASEAILEINNSGLSLIEISHRSKDFVDIMDNATSTALELLDLQNKTSIKTFLIGESLLKNLSKNSIFSLL